MNHNNNTDPTKAWPRLWIGGTVSGKDFAIAREVADTFAVITSTGKARNPVLVQAGLPTIDAALALLPLSEAGFRQTYSRADLMEVLVEPFATV